VRTFGFGADAGRHVDQHGSDFVISRLVHSDAVHIACMRLGPGGRVGYHPAATYQLFAIVEGEGWVRGETGDSVPVRTGQAAFWEPGERHAAGTDTGMVAMVVEGDVLAVRPEKLGPVGPPGGQTPR
jgi:quercetin dioxygenase-like cupin family protein